MDQFEREARSLLNSVQKELRTIPKMPDVSGKASKKIGEAIVTGPAVAVTLLRRGIRILKGGEPSSKLKQKEKKLKSFLNRVEKKFGIQAKKNIQDKLKIKLKSKNAHYVFP